ncbi:MAG: transcription elongation factor GreA [Clostridiales bacterium]|nr:transcription elongation factor GreA [Clostridiales bacterium]
MAANNINEMTREGYNKLNEELDHLVTVVRPENADRLREAISLGDISENAEYDAAKDAQAETEERISTIEEILRTAVIVDENDTDGDDNTVQTGRTVTIRDLILDIESTYKIVGTTEADPLAGKLSNASVVGEHLLGCKTGDVVEFQVPDGMAKYEILEVSK